MLLDYIRPDRAGRITQFRQNIENRCARKGGDTVAKDPICGMDVDEKTAKYKTNYQGKTYYFCAPGCQKTFEANPQKYLK